jgi:hypothetical protein
MDDYRQYIKFKGRGKTFPHLHKIRMDKLSEAQTRALATEGPGHILGDAIHVVEIIDAFETVSTVENIEKPKPISTAANILKFMKECRCGCHDSLRNLAEATGIDFALICRHAKGKHHPRGKNRNLYLREFSNCQGRKITIAELFPEQSN